MLEARIAAAVRAVVVKEPVKFAKEQFVKPAEIVAVGPQELLVKLAEEEPIAEVAEKQLVARVAER